MVGSFEMELDSINEETGEPDSVYAQFEVLPDDVNAEDVDELEDTTVITIVTTGEDNSVSVEETDGELNLSIDTDSAK